VDSAGGGSRSGGTRVAIAGHSGQCEAGETTVPLAAPRLPWCVQLATDACSEGVVGTAAARQGRTSALAVCAARPTLTAPRCWAGGLAVIMRVYASQRRCRRHIPDTLRHMCLAAHYAGAILGPRAATITRLSAHAKTARPRRSLCRRFWTLWSSTNEHSGRSPRNGPNMSP